MPLPPGQYRAVCTETSALAAALNGHRAVWPEAIAVSDGDWVWFYQEHKAVYSCNAAYAAHNFSCSRIPESKESRKATRRSR